MSWFLLNRNLTLLEPYDWKLSRTVLRGERGSNASDLPGKALSTANMAEYLRYMYKTVRKYYGEAIVVTQEVEDIISSPVVKEAIINNSDCKILLDQRKFMNRFDAIQSLLGLTDKEKAQILSINQSNNPSRKYKEVWIGLGGVQSAVYATEVSVPEYLAYTTEETEKVEVQRLAGELGGDIELAIRQLAGQTLKGGQAMYRKCIGSDPTAARLDFALYEVAGEWESRSGSPRVRIYRNPGRRGGGFYVEVSYKDGTRFSRPVRKYWGGIRYFDLYGYVALAYDVGREVLQLSAYGDYYRASE